jgi:hypothetical protein
MTPMRPRLVRADPLRRLGAVLLATALALVVGISPAAVEPVLAAGPLRIEADAVYDLDPSAGRVRVAVDIELTNLKPDTATTFFYYTSAFFVVQPDAVNIRASDASGPLSVTTRERRFYTRVNVNLRNSLFYQQSTRLTLSYDMVGGKPRSDSWVRVSSAFVTFSVWAWGDAGRSTVKVRIPEGYRTTLSGDDMQADRDGPGEILTAEPDKPNRFYAILNAENESAYTSTRISLAGDIELVVRAWPEDDRWERTVTETLRTGMPELVDLIGLDWPVDHDLEVLERFTPALEGYAGIFYTFEERIELSEDLDPVTIIHEASHAWFNAQLFAERWVFEGLAQDYAWRARLAVGEPAGPAAFEPHQADPGRTDLDVWNFPSVIRDQETDDSERYGYQASYWVVHTIVEAAGVEHMRSAFDAAQSNVTAYVGAPPPESVSVEDDWRRFIDLAQTIGAPDSAEVEAALRELVVQPGDVPLIDRRHDARAAYRELVTAGDGWQPPWYVRRPMGEWKFDLAEDAMDQATAVLALRDEVDAAAAALAIEPDDAFRAAYETATTSFDDANAIAADQLAALTAIADARSKAEAPVDLVAQLGLLGATSPSAAYDAARAAFERGELDAAVASAGAVSAALTGAAALGQERLIMGVAVALGLLLLVALFLVLRRRRRGRGLLAPATIAVPATVAAPLGSVPAYVGALDASADRPLWPGTPPALAAEPAVAPDGPPSPSEWPAVDLAPRVTTEQPEPAWWLPTRNSPDPAGPEPSGTLATDPASPSPPPAANPPDLEGDAAPGEPTQR